MKRLSLILSFVLLGSLLAAGSALAQEDQNWADKGGGFGVGVNTSLGGTNGLNFRYWITPVFGLQATLGMRFASATIAVEDVDNSDTEYSMTEFDIALYGVYKLAYWQRGSLGVMLGADIQAFSETLNPPGEGETDRSSTNFLLGLGIQGEFFPTQYLSLFAQGGFTLDFINDGDLTCNRTDLGSCASGSAISGDPDSVDASGFALGLSGDLFGAAGFTVWFK